MIGDLLKNMIGPIIGPLIDRIPDPNERARAKEQVETQMLSAMTSLVQGQLAINEKQAQHGSIFTRAICSHAPSAFSLALRFAFLGLTLRIGVFALRGVRFMFRRG